MARPSSGSVRRLPSGQWQARVSHHGRQLTIGSFVTQREALDAIAQARGDGVRGLLFDPARGRIKVETIVERWWATRVGHRVSTRARDRMVLDRHTLPILGSAQLVEVTRDDVQAWVNELAERFAPSTVQRSFTVLRQVLDLAVGNRLVATNPSDRTAMPRRQQFEARLLTPGELEMLADTHPRGVAGHGALDGVGHAADR